MSYSQIKAHFLTNCLQVTAATGQSVAVAGQQHITAVPVHSVSYAAPSTSQQPTITDPGRTVVQAPKPAEPVFVAPPNSVQIKRVMHSEVYLRLVACCFIGQICQQNEQRVSKMWISSFLCFEYRLVSAIYGVEGTLIWKCLLHFFFFFWCWELSADSMWRSNFRAVKTVCPQTFEI